mmetsp:Transcript_30830/g.42958  ORF Transcript_30830/g.42958 Transcript_30830/m.42958 type:complete len:438 (-) Transcript_30830:281-1594(-)
MFEEYRKCKLCSIIFISAYVAVISLLAAYEDSNFQQRVARENKVRDQLKSSEIDLLHHAVLGPNKSDPCPFVREAAEKFELDALNKEQRQHQLSSKIGRRLMGAAEFRKNFYEDSIPTLPNGVPKVIHQTWWSRKLKEKNVRLSASWFRCMPDWIHVLWDDDDVIELYRDYRPDLLEMMNGYPYGVQRSDMFRYLALYIYGGVYADMDYECVKDISSEDGVGSLSHSVFMSGAPNPLVDGKAQNTLMASTRGHPFWAHVLSVSAEQCGRMYEPELFIRFFVALRLCTLASRVRKFFGWTGISVLSTTGPRMLSQAYETFPAELRGTVKLLEVDIFNGQMDRGAKDGGAASEGEGAIQDLRFACAEKSIHRNSAGWTKNSAFPYTGDHTVFGKRLPHRLIAILIIEVGAVILAGIWCFYCFQNDIQTFFSVHRDRKDQ